MTFNKTLPQDVLTAAVGGNLTAMIHFAGAIFVYPFIVPVSANEESNVTFDVAVTGSCFMADPDCDGGFLFFRPETAYFEVGFRFNHQQAGEVTVSGLRVQIEDT